MNLTVFPTDSLQGSLDLPASKSYTIRAFLVAACGGTSIIKNTSDCDDALVALNLAESLGARIRLIRKGTYQIFADAKLVRLNQINVQESGTVLRFLLPLLPFYTQKTRITGEGTLKERPNYFLTRALRQQGIHIRGKGPKESVPITLEGGQLKGGRIFIDGSLSSQFISALLIACPLLAEDTELIIQGPYLVSSEYIIMTCQVLKKSGIKIEREGGRIFYIRGRQFYKGLKEFTIPADYGLAAFHLAAGALVPSRLVLKGPLPSDLQQADAAILPLLRKMGARVVQTRRSLVLRRDTGPPSLRSSRKGAVSF